MKEYPSPPLDMTVRDGQYILNKKIGTGSFGQVYLGFERGTGREIAIKLEHKESTRNMIGHEYIIYMKCLRRGNGFPRILWYGLGGDYRVLVMELMGPNLSNLLKQCGGTFHLRTVIRIAIQTLDRIQYLHDKSFIHRDLKPDNFVIGRHQKKKGIYLLDFGLSVRYKREDGYHVRPSKESRFIGTIRYASVNSHLGYRLSRRDDLESWFYIIMYFLHGRLPWMGYRNKNKERYHKKICQLKKNITAKELVGTDAPSQFIRIFEHIKSLQFNQRPNYNYMRHLLDTIMTHYEISIYEPYDWESEYSL